MMDNPTTRRLCPVLLLVGSIALAAAAVAAAAGRPIAAVASDTYRFEPVIEGTELVHEFMIANTGTAPLEILKVETG
jgi:hypothetical protein